VAWPGVLGLDLFHCYLCGRWETALPLYPSVRFIQSDFWQTLGESPQPMWKKIKELRLRRINSGEHRVSAQSCFGGADNPALFPFKPA
jgi:hypothetical protein